MEMKSQGTSNAERRESKRTWRECRNLGFSTSPANLSPFPLTVPALGNNLAEKRLNFLLHYPFQDPLAALQGFICLFVFLSFFFPEVFGQRGLISHFHTTPFVCSVHRRSFFLTALLSLVTILCGMRCENGIFYWWETNNVSVSTCFIISLVVSFLWPRNWFCKQCMRFYSFVYGWLDFWVIRSYGLWICLYM